MRELEVEVLVKHIRQSPLYTLAAIQQGTYVIGMKDQFNAHDLPSHPLQHYIRYIADDTGFILVDKCETKASSLNLDTFGPYFIEQYILMEVLSKHEVAATVMEHYVHHKDKLQRGLEKYSEKQGKGFICWRFISDC